MRSLLWMLVFAGIAAVGYGYWAETRKLALDDRRAAIARGSADLGLKRMLVGHGGYAFSDLVIGRRSPDGHLDFRGRITRDRRSMPAYGQAKPLCEIGLDAADCWQIVYLEVDGMAEAVNDGPVLLADLKNRRSRRLDRTERLLETADIKPMLAAPAALPTSVTGIEQPPKSSISVAWAPVPLPRGAATSGQDAPEPMATATHAVALPKINGRAGPGLDWPVITKLRRGTKLVQIGGKRGWGEFQIVGGAVSAPADRKVWAALSVLSPQSAAPASAAEGGR